MKKLLLFALGTAMALPTMAQEEQQEVDVTNLIVNAGFDEDLTFQADGTMKAAISTNTSLSDRSWAYIAADSTVYARPKSTSSQNRSDGRKMEAVNGFKGRINGWKLESNADFPKCEWTYFGSVAYDLGATAVPIADDGSTYLVVPARPANGEFEAGDGFVYLRAGWGGQAIYKQVVSLPCAQYRLEYWTININQNTTSTVTDLTQIKCRKDVFKDEDNSKMQAKQWTKHEFEFTPTSEFTMQFGYQAANAGSGGMPIVALDGIKLYKIGEADREELLSSDIYDVVAEASELSGQCSISGFSGLSAWLSDFSMGCEDSISTDVDAMEASLKILNAKMVQIRAAVDEMANVDAILSKMDNLLQTTNFAGKADFEAAYQKILGYKTNTNYGDADVPTLILGAVAEANEAIRAYYLSQEASVESPADYTYFVANPWFIKTGLEPTFEEGVWVYPNAANYTDGSSNDDFTSVGWEKTGTYTGGDQRLNFKFGLSCWNAWGSGINGTIAVGQTIENLPNGYYTASADMVTQAGYLTDQHVYLQSTAEKKISAPLTVEGWDEGIWTNVAMTAEQKVLVVDGKLTIGAEGTGTGEGSAGWFCVTNFRLNFLGAASQEEINAALKKAYDEQVDSANAVLAKIVFAADKKALAAAIEKYKDATDYLMAVDSLKPAIAEAQKSVDKYTEYLPAVAPEDITTKTMLWVKALLDGQAVEGKAAYSENAKAIAQFAYDYVMNWVASDSATYTQMDNRVNALKNYVNTYLPAYQDAEAVAEKASVAGKAYLNGIMDEQKVALVAAMQPSNIVNDYVAVLKAAATLVAKQNLYDDVTAKDYTVYIVNPNLEAEDGWTFDKGNGNTNTTSGQWFDGSNTRYIDSYHSQTVVDSLTQEETVIGLQNFKASQDIKGLPNGTYTVGVYTRTPAEGAYIFAAAGDTTFVEIPLDYYMNDMDEQQIASDTHGPLWEQAKEKMESLADTDPDYNYWSAIYNANNVLGRGWKHQEIANIVVNNHELTIGTMAGTAASATEKVFGGSWYSVGGWTLTLVAMGDNANWGGPIVEGIESVKANTAVTDGIYTLTGVKTSKMQRGLNIVVRNGKAVKVMVK